MKMGSNKLKIGNVSLDGNIVLAPMAGVTDLPFRLLCKEQGADLICTEMVSAKGIFYNNKNTEDLLRIDDRERPVSLQLFGSDPDIISEMAKKIEHRNFDILDINMGCPVPKVVNNGEGSALLKNIPLAAKIIEKTVKAIDKPVTVKFRKGFGADEVQAIEMANIYSGILNGTMDTFASVISNNQNSVMKFLTTITIVLSIPTMIASFYGMNVKSFSMPFADSEWGFPIVIGISLIISLIIAFIFRKKDLF